MDRSQHKWTERDFNDLDGVLVTGDDAYVTPERLARMLQASPEDIEARVAKRRIPSVRGFLRGTRLIPLSLLEAQLAEAKAGVTEALAGGNDEPDHDDPPQHASQEDDGDDPISLLGRRRRRRSD